jgi:hypothetical protein
MRNLGCREGRWQEQAWKRGFLIPRVLVLELHLWVMAQGQKGGPQTAHSFKREQDVFRKIRIPRELDIKTNWRLKQILLICLWEGHVMTIFVT